MATILFLIGLPASGKSTIGKFIASKYPFCYLDKDVVCNAFTEQLLNTKGVSSADRECSYYRDIVMELEYKTLLDIGNDNLKLGKSVIIDAPFVRFFSNRQYIDQLRETYQWNNVTPIVLQVEASLATLKERLIKRALVRDQWKLENWDFYTQSVQDNKCLWENIKILQVGNNQPSIDRRYINEILNSNGY